MLSIKINGPDPRKLVANLKADMQRATAAALTQTAREIERATKAEMAAAFDRPKPFTTNGMFVRPAQPGRLEAVVGFKKRQSAYLRAQIEGGTRATKGVEQRLGQRKFTPGQGVRLDQYGNVGRGTLLAILRAARTGSTYQGGKVFIGKPQPDVPDGVWKSTKRGLVPLLIFVDKEPRYQRRLDFYGLATRTARARLRVNLAAAMRR